MNNLFAYNFILILLSIGVVLYLWDALFPPEDKK